jgi:hypothetical protein
MIRIDPARPPVCCDLLRCPACRQTLAAIIGDGQDLPAWHRRYPTKAGVRIDNKGGGGRGRGQIVCTYSGDDLARIVFIAQTKAEHA